MTNIRLQDKVVFNSLFHFPPLLTFCMQNDVKWQKMLISIASAFSSADTTYPS